MTHFHKFIFVSLGLILILVFGLGIWQVTNAQDGVQAKLTYPEITTVLNTKIPNQTFKNKIELIDWLIAQIKSRKADKPLTEDREDDLRQAGATNELIETIRANSPPLSKPTPVSASTPISVPVATPAIAPSPTPKTAGAISKSKLPNNVEMSFAYIPAGSFEMGSGAHWEKITKVIISKGFWLGQTEVTQAQWTAIMGALPSTCGSGGQLTDVHDNKPIVCISWSDAIKFVDMMNSKDDVYEYALPTEAEWEFACRAGTTGDYAGTLDEMAWYWSGGNAPRGLREVAKKQPNAWNLFDMHGNANEWVLDSYGPYPGGTVTDPGRGWFSGDHVYRGGSWISSREQLSSGSRGGGGFKETSPTIGFRLKRLETTTPIN